MHTVTFEDRACQDVREVGGKALGLAEMTVNGLPVAPGFAVTASAYREFLDATGIRAEVERVLDGVHLGDPAELRSTATRLEEILYGTPLPDTIAAQIRDAYGRLCVTTGVDDIAVAVRSSATAEDSVGASFAGEFETWVDVVGADSVLEHVHKCYASVYSARVLDYVHERGIDPHAIEMAVVVQKTVRARAAGVMFTISPISGDRSKIAIEASWGLGLSVVGGEVNPDRFLVDKIGMAVSERTVGDKRIEYRRGDAATEVPQERRAELCLTDDEVRALAGFGKRLERLHGGAQDIEFAIDEELPDGKHIVLLQCRPETVWSKVQRTPAFPAGAGVMSWITGSISGAGATQQTAAHGHDHP